jgi:hypothetical protein
MTGEIRREHDPAAEIPERLARLCADLPDLAGIMPGAESDALLARLRAAGSDRQALAGVLRDFEELLRRLGVADGLGSYRGADGIFQPSPGFTPLPGTAGGRPLEEADVCPRGLCARVEVPRSMSGAIPTCSLWSLPLSRIRVDR